ncbi:hypothetical protein DPMN_098877 [Dreissena polymorpha]|uniref:Uncharacterized protein n=1 Tax=Dreissena polymorpha TaxID=45954 RepID=A0A9D4R5X1_DREPO|nr:hypothetical protein DPMN_098877 [Dreissena polymorpha]
MKAQFNLDEAKSLIEIQVGATEAKCLIQMPSLRTRTSERKFGDIQADSFFEEYSTSSMKLPRTSNGKYLSVLFCFL